MIDDRERVIRELFPLVRAIARRMRTMLNLAELDDLVGDGCIGLIRAVDRFDPARGNSLAVYAKRSIAGAMLNGIRRRDPVSERVRRAVRRAEARRFALAQERMALPSMNELERDDPALRVARTTAYRQTALSLDAPIPDARRDPLTDADADPGRIHTIRERRRALGAAVAALPQRQRRVLALHYGDPELSLHAIGCRMHISAQRVSQLHLAALQRLRHTLPAAP